MAVLPACSCRYANSVHSEAIECGSSLVGDLLHQRDGLSRTGARAGVAGDGGGRVHVVAHHHHRPGGVAHVQQRAQADHLSLIVAHLELPDVATPGREIAGRPAR